MANGMNLAYEYENPRRGEVTQRKEVLALASDSLLGRDFVHSGL